MGRRAIPYSVCKRLPVTSWGTGNGREVARAKEDNRNCTFAAVASQPWQNCWIHLNTISPIVEECLIGTFANPCSIIVQFDLILGVAWPTPSTTLTAHQHVFKALTNFAPGILKKRLVWRNLKMTPQGKTVDTCVYFSLSLSLWVLQ